MTDAEAEKHVTMLATAQVKDCLHVKHVLQQTEHDLSTFQHDLCTFQHYISHEHIISARY